MLICCPTRARSTTSHRQHLIIPLFSHFSLEVLNLRSYYLLRGEIAVISHIYSSREANRQHQMQLFTQIYSHVVTKDYAQDYLEWRDLFKWPGWNEYYQQYGAKANLEMSAKQASNLPFNQ